MAIKRSRKKSVDAAIGLVINNTDLLFEIFLRLPALSLIRFKLVSKSWLSLISDSEFGITHSRRNTIECRVSHLYYQDCDEDKLSISLNGYPSFPAMKCLDHAQFPPISGPNYPRIVNSCNGLILIQQGYNWNHMVFNPTTQKYRLLIIPSEYLPKPEMWSYSPSNSLLAFEPLKSHHYKVVILVRAPGRKTFHVLIFSSQSESWKKNSITTTRGEICTRKIYWSGSIHWLTVGNVHMQFDVDAEKLIETPLPPKPVILREDKVCYFGESDGRLFLIQCRRRGAPGFRMLEMDMNTHSWSIKHQINLRPLVLEFPEIQPDPGSKYFQYSVTHVKSGPDKKSFSLVLIIFDKIVLYDVEKGRSYPSIKMVCKFPYRDRGYPYGGISRKVHPLIQCLSPV